MYIIVWLKNDYGENKSSHKYLIKEFINAFWVEFEAICISLKQSHIKLTMISQIIRILENMLKPKGELATKILIGHREANPLCRTGNHKYKAENYPSNQSGEYALV